jgi:hypothetical protein
MYVFCLTDTDSFRAWGNAPANRANRKPSAESAIRLLALWIVLSCAFSAGAWLDSNPRASPQASFEKAPLALNRYGVINARTQKEKMQRRKLEEQLQREEL